MGTKGKLVQPKRRTCKKSNRVEGPLWHGGPKWVINQKEKKVSTREGFVSNGGEKKSGRDRCQGPETYWGGGTYFQHHEPV